LHAQRTKERILKAAIQLFKENGYNNVGIEEIANAAEVSRGSFYVYYKNKDDLLAEYLHSLDQVYNEYYETVLCGKECSSLNSLEKFNLYMKYTLQVSSENSQDLIRMYYAYLTKSTNTWARRDRCYFPILEKLIAMAQEEGSIRKDISIESIENISLGITRGLTLEWCASDESVTMESKFPVIDDFCTMLMPNPKK